jgi:prevent-host-death family protein
MMYFTYVMDTKYEEGTRFASTTEVRESVAEYLNEVAYGRKRVVIRRRGKDLAALIPIDDYRMLLRMEEALEDHLDLEEAREALKDPRNRERIPWKKVKKDLGL